MFTTFGVKNTINKVNPPKSKADGFTKCKVKTKFLMLSIVLENGFNPINGLSCIMIIIAPTPFMKPEITGYGTYFTISGSFVTDKTNCKIPAPKIINITDEISWFRECIIEAITIATGPVIPDIIGTFEPNIPEIKHNIIAPQMPAPAPNPVATPKASACGRAITAELIPPNKSPKKIFNLVFANSKFNIE